MIVRPWQRGDSERVLVQQAQRYSGDLADVSQDLTPLSEVGLAWTGEHDGLVIGCGGLLPVWENRAIAWMLIGENAGPHFAAVHKHVKRFLDRCPYRRIEAHVDVGFEQGIRWMAMLGFELEVYRRAFRPDGADMLEFVRIRSWPSPPLSLRV
jgi:hypothetical protein